MNNRGLMFSHFRCGPWSLAHFHPVCLIFVHYGMFTFTYACSYFLNEEYFVV